MSPHRLIGLPCAIQPTFEHVCTAILCLDHVAEVLQLSLLDSGYKFSVCADLVQHRFIRSVVFTVNSQHRPTSVTCHLEGFQLVNVAFFECL